MILRCLLVLLLAGAPTLGSAGALARATDRLPQVEAPPMGEEQWIARSMRLNGLPMTLKAFTSKWPTDALLHHYQSWAATLTHAQTRRSRVEGAQVLAIRTPDFLITIQARTVLGGCEGTIAVSAAPDTTTVQVASDFPLPRSVTIANLQQYDDLGLEAEHISATSVRGVATEAAAFVQRLSGHGWQLTRQRSSTQFARGYVIEAQKGAQHAMVTLMPDHAAPGMTAIVIVWRKA